jgi:hypothetical protein
MEFKKCEQCGEYGFVGAHKCPPAWVVILHEDDEYAQKYYSREPQGAAIQAAVEYDAGEYDLANGKELVVAVDRWNTWIDHAEDTREQIDTYIANMPHYTCAAQLVPEYSAKLVKK